MPVEILTASLRREWERFPEEIDEATLSAFFSFADDELELIAGHRGVHGRFAIAVAVGAVRWLGFVPAALAELPEPAAALVASQLDIDLSSIDPKRLHVERDRRAGLVVLTPELQGALDRLLDVPASATAAPVKQLCQETRTVREIGESIEKLELLRRLGAEQWDLETHSCEPSPDARPVRSPRDEPGNQPPRPGVSPSRAARILRRNRRPGDR